MMTPRQDIIDPADAGIVQHALMFGELEQRTAVQFLTMFQYNLDSQGRHDFFGKQDTGRPAAL
jgi:hypothetical protein